ncbi:hypothetical protein EDC04DRAFT_2606630 [Pisolithus marmoratus]|nr:hypothetical protein EDC04DRAFT_2606630 [Pisolithus marmoratus]
MLQNIANTGLPTPTATQDWTTVPDEAIQLASDDDKESADVKYAEHQCWKQVKKECKAAEEASEHVRVAQVEAEHWEMEAHEAREKEAWERAELTMRGGGLGDEQAVQGASGGQARNECTSTGRVRKPQADRELEVEGAGVECMFELAKASKHGKKSCDQCSGLKGQCMLPGGLNSVLKKKQVPGETTSLRAKVEVQAGPSRSESITGEMLVAWGLHTIVAAIDQHTSKMAKHQQITKETQCMQRQFNNCLYELLQEMKYWQVAEVGELSDEESTGVETSNGETDKDVEGEEAPESDPEEYHKMKTGSQGWHRGLEVPEEGDGGDVNRSFKYQKGYQSQESRPGGLRAGGWQGKAGKQVLVTAKSEGHLSKKVWSVVKPERDRVVVEEKKVVSTPGWASEVVMKAGLGEGDWTMESEARFAKSKSQKGQQVLLQPQLINGSHWGKCNQGNPAEWRIIDASWSLELDQNLARLTSSPSRGELGNQGQGVTQEGSRSPEALVEEWRLVDRCQANVQRGGKRVLDVTTWTIVNLSKWQ